MCPYLAVLLELDRLSSGSLIQMARAAHSLGEISHYVDKLTEAWYSTVFYEQTLSLCGTERAERAKRGEVM